jgi:hypothetical protein
MVEQNGVDRWMELLCHGGPTSCLSIGLSSFDHFSIRYIGAFIFEDAHQTFVSLLQKKKDCFAGDSRETILQLVVWRISRWFCHAECPLSVASSVLSQHFIATEFYSGRCLRQRNITAICLANRMSWLSY